MAFEGKVTQRDGEPVLIVKIGGQETTFELEKLREGVYELVDDKVLIVNGTEVDMVITEKGAVTHYCEAVTPDEVDPDEIEVE